MGKLVQGAPSLRLAWVFLGGAVLGVLTPPCPCAFSWVSPRGKGVDLGPVLWAGPGPSCCSLGDPGGYSSSHFVLPTLQWAGRAGGPYLLPVLLPASHTCLPRPICWKRRRRSPLKWKGDAWANGEVAIFEMRRLPGATALAPGEGVQGWGAGPALLHP